MPKTREQYMQLAEDALYVRRDDACAAVYVSLAQMAEPAETVTTHTGDGREVRTDTVAQTVKVGGATLGDRIAVQSVARAIWGDQSPDWLTLDGLARRGIGDYREVRDETIAAADRVVGMLLGAPVLPVVRPIPPVCANHNPTQHRDGRGPWCNHCKRAADRVTHRDDMPRNPGA